MVSLVLRAHGDGVTPAGECPRPTARSLLERAREPLQDGELLELARRVRWRGFAGGATWMAAACARLDGEPSSAPSRARGGSREQWLGVLKYGLAAGAALLAGVTIGFGATQWCGGGVTGWSVGGLAGGLTGVVAFYVVEGQMVFAFPLHVQGCGTPLRSSRRRVRQAGGTSTVVPTTMRIAWHMVTGVFRRQGALAAWCEGCLAVVLWSEDAAHRSDPGPSLAWCERGPLVVRHEVCRVARPLAHPLRVLFLSDLHLRGGNAQRLVSEVVDRGRDARPDVILLGGDFVDSRRGLAALSQIVESLVSMAPTYAIAGNHDRWVGLSDIRETIRSAGATWLASEEWEWCTRSGVRAVIRHIAPRATGPEAAPPAGYDVALAVVHVPRHAERRAPGADVVFAGHLHGGQCVLWQTGDGRQWPGGLYSRWTGLRFAQETRTVLVSRGVADSFPLRWRCPRELILCEVRGVERIAGEVAAQDGSTE